MKILIIGSDFGGFRIKKRVMMCLTMYQIAGILRSVDQQVDVIDPSLFDGEFYKLNFEDELKRKSIDVDLVAFSVNSFNTANVFEMINKVKQYNQNAYIVVGGIQASRYYDIFLTYFSSVDFLLRGDAELSFPQLLKCIEKNGDLINVPNLVYKKKDKIVINSLDFNVKLNGSVPLPAYDLLPKDAYSYISIDTSRGCVCNCSFCSILGHKNWRFYSVEDAIERIKFAINAINSPNMGISFTDDCFTSNTKRAINILEYMIESGYNNLPIFLEARINDLKDEKLLYTMSKFDKLNIQVGIECGYEEGLKKIGKGININDVDETAKKLYDFGISKKTLFSFISGFPWETKKECIKTINKAAKYNKQYGINVNCAWWLPLPSRLLSTIDEEHESFRMYMDKNWLYSDEVFEKYHPLLSPVDLTEISNIARVFSSFKGIRLFS